MSTLDRLPQDAAEITLDITAPRPRPEPPSVVELPSDVGELVRGMPAYGG